LENYASPACPGPSENKTTGGVFHDGASQIETASFNSSHFFSIPLIHDITSPDLTPHPIIHALRQYHFDNTILSNTLYNNTFPLNPRFVTKSVLSEQRQRPASAHQSFTPAGRH